MNDPDPAVAAFWMALESTIDGGYSTTEERETALRAGLFVVIKDAMEHMRAEILKFSQIDNNTRRSILEIDERYLARAMLGREQ